MTADGAALDSVVVPGHVTWARRRLARVLSLAFLALYALPFGAMSVLLGALVNVVAWALLIASYIVWFSETTMLGRVQVTATHLHVVRGSRHRAYARSEVASALAVQRQLANGTVLSSLEIELTSGDRFTVGVGEPRAAAKIVDALGFGRAGGPRVRVGLDRPTRRLFHPLLGFGVRMAAQIAMLAVTFHSMVLGMALTAVVSAALYLFLRTLFRGPHVTVGDDGVEVRRGLRRRFFHRKDIAELTRTIGGAGVLLLRDGTEVRMGSIGIDQARVDAVGAVLAERYGTSLVAKERLGAFSRPTGDVRAWRAEIERSMQTTDYRSNAISIDDAVAALASPDASPEQRVGAALALRLAGGPAERIRVAADAVVDKKVRVALEAIADDDDVRIEKALSRG
mgnify:CR=1 FL=1